MGVPAIGKFYKSSLGGSINDADVWTINTWWHVTSFTTEPGQGDCDSVASSLLSDFNSIFWSPASNGFKTVNSPATTTTDNKVFYYKDGVLTFESHTTISPTAGTAGNSQPAYCSQVTTLLTAGFGRSRRGRLYMPRTGVGGSASTLQYTLTQAMTDNLASWLGHKTYSAGNVSLESVVMSLTLGQAFPITSIRTDSIPDTQRGRFSKSKAAFTHVHTVS